MQKPACLSLLALLIAASLLPATVNVAAGPGQRLSPPPDAPQPNQAREHQAPGPAQPSSAKKPSADQLRGQEFREHIIHDSDDYNPTEALHDIEVGHFYRVQGDYPGALSRFQEALRHDPNATDALYEAGEIEMKLHQPGQARGYFQRYLAADPGGKHAHHVQSILKKLNRTHRSTSSNQ